MKNIVKIKRIYKTITAILILAVFFDLSFISCQAVNNLDIPKIIYRSQWGADEKKVISPAEYARTDKFIIHHTASSKLVPDSDGSGEYKNMVNNIFLYHLNGRGWNDIGYNYLIDPNGNIYEGRSGGNSVIGVHAGSYNTGSIGISVLGTYGGNVKGEYLSNSLTYNIIKSLEKLIGWVAANNSIDLNKINGQNSKGKNLDGVVGHRDVGATNCPGDELYQKLGNIQNDAITYANIYKNYAYQIGGDKSVYILADGYKMKFNSAKELPGAYQNNIIKPISTIQLEMYKYKNIVIYPDGSLLQKFDEPTVYYLENGKKRALSMSGEDFIKMGFEATDLKKVFESDLKLYDDGAIIKYGPDGSLLSAENGNVYLIEKGQKRKFTSAQLFEYLNYKWKDVKKDAEIGFCLEDLDMIYPDGTLVKSVGSSKVYLIKNKQRREITSGILFETLNYKWEDILSITEDEIDHFPVGAKMVYPDGVLIKADNSAAIYFVENGKKREFTSLTLFEKLGYNWDDVISIKNEEIDNHPLGGNVLYPDGILIRSADNPDIYLLESGKKRKITSLKLFEKLGYNWNDVTVISLDEFKAYSSGKNLVYPKGTLIKREGYPVVYKIEDGTKKRFTSLALFEATKSNWVDVLDLSKEEFMIYSDGGALKYPNGTLIKQIEGDKIYVMKNGNAEWIKSLEEFEAAGYKWSNVLEVASEEMNLYVDINLDINIKEEEIESDQNIADSKNVENNNDSINNDTDHNGDNINNKFLMRVAIYSTTSEDVAITANGNYSVNYYNSDNLIYKTENKSSGEQTVIPCFNSSDYLKFIPATENVILEILSYEDLSWNKEANDNKFRGNLEIKFSNASKKLWVVNELPLEDYVNGIAEASNSSPEEYLKAFSTIARTYAMYYLKRGGKHIGEPFYLKNSRNDNGNDQHYKGYNFEMRAPQIVVANKLTSGYIINYNDNPIVAAYSSDSGGVTKSGCEALSANYCSVDYAYLNGGVADPKNTKHDSTKIAASHGAGMSAVGAYQMAENGIAWQEIIEHYYLGVEAEKYY